MLVLKIVAVFAIIMVAFHFKRPLWQAMLLGSAAIVLIFWMNPIVLWTSLKDTVISWPTWQMILVMILITVLQRILEKRQQLKLAVASMNGLSKDKRVNAELCSFFMGMLPSAAVVTIAGDIIDDTAGDALTPVEKATCASYFRHISEAFVPTYAAILLACTLANVQISSFLLAFLPMVVVLFVLGHIIYMRKIPKGEAASADGSKGTHALNLLKSLWTIIAVIVLIVAFNLDVVIAVSIVLVLAIFIYKVNLQELWGMVKTAMDVNLLLGLFAVFLFKNVMGYAGIIDALPDLFGKLPLPTWLTFALLFVLGSIVAGSQAVIAAFMPLAFATVPNAGVPLFVLLMGCTYAAMQVSPTHICIAISADHFHVSMGDVIKKSVPIIASFLVVLCGYYLLLGLFL